MVRVSLRPVYHHYTQDSRHTILLYLTDRAVSTRSGRCRSEFFIRSSRYPRLPQLQPLSARYNLIQKKKKKLEHRRVAHPHQQVKPPLAPPQNEFEAGARQPSRCVLSEKKERSTHVYWDVRRECTRVVETRKRSKPVSATRIRGHVLFFLLFFFFSSFLLFYNCTATGSPCCVCVFVSLLRTP